MRQEEKNFLFFLLGFSTIQDLVLLISSQQHSCFGNPLTAQYPSLHSEFQVYIRKLHVYCVVCTVYIFFYFFQIVCGSSGALGMPRH